MADLLLLLKSQSQIQVIVPYMVVRELDGLKSFSGPTSDPSRSSDSKQLISDCARQAISLLYTNLQSGNSGIHGQTMTETTRQGSSSNGSPDDSILDCCLFWKEKHTLQASVILLSNDKNLCVKALVHSIKTVSNPKTTAEKFTSRLKSHLMSGTPIEDAMNELDPLRASLNTASTQPHQHGDMDVDDDEVLHGTRAFHTNHEECSSLTVNTESIYQPANHLDETTWDIINLLERCLHEPLKVLLSKAYGATDWQAHVPQKEPWNVADLFQILFSHDMVAFPCLSRYRLSTNASQLKMLAKDLERSRRNKKSLLTSGDLSVFLKDVTVILEIIKDAGMLDLFEQAQSQLRIIQSDFEKVRSPS
jgi:hypothetical protein